MRSLLAFLSLLLACAAAQSGPWPREKGQTFLAFSVTSEAASLWAERGLGRGNWLSAELRYGRDHSYSAMLSFNRALPDLGAWKFAWHVGAKVEMPPLDAEIDLWYPPWVTYEIKIKWRPILSGRAGFSAGRPLSRPWPGWFAADLWLEHKQDAVNLKADLTLGYRPRESVMMVAQLQAAKIMGGKLDLHLAPSLLWEPRKGLHLELGLRQAIGGGGTSAKIGSWITF